MLLYIHTVRTWNPGQIFQIPAYEQVSCIIYTSRRKVEPRGGHFPLYFNGFHFMPFQVYILGSTFLLHVYTWTRNMHTGWHKMEPNRDRQLLGSGFGDTLMLLYIHTVGTWNPGQIFRIPAYEPVSCIYIPSKSRTQRGPFSLFFPRPKPKLYIHGFWIAGSKSHEIKIIYIYIYVLPGLPRRSRVLRPVLTRQTRVNPTLFCRVIPDRLSCLPWYQNRLLIYFLVTRFNPTHINQDWLTGDIQHRICVTAYRPTREVESAAILLCCCCRWLKDYFLVLVFGLWNAGN